MSNTPMILNGAYPVIPSGLMDQMVGLFDDSFAGLGGTLRMITVEKLNFKLVDGTAVQSVPFDQLFVVFCGAANVNHAVWWEKKWNPNSPTATPPDLVWKMETMNTFPAALPKQFHTKVVRDGRLVWDFQIRRRLGFIVAKPDPANNSFFLDFDHPYIMDISSASMFGPSFPDSNQYKWGAIRDMCNQASTPSQRVLPFMFPMQIVPNAAVTVSGPVLFKPRKTPEGAIAFLSGDIISRVIDVAQSEAMRTMLDVQEKLSYGDQPQAQPVVVQPSAPAPQPVPQPAPAPQPAPQLAPQPVPQPVLQPAPQSAVQASIIQAQQPAPQSAETLLDDASALLNTFGAAPTQMAEAPKLPTQQPEQPAQQDGKAVVDGNVDDMLRSLQF